MVANYARVSAEDLASIRGDPEQFWNLAEMSWDLDDPVEATASESLYIDKDWLVLSWLCSPLGRAEERNQTALVRVAQRRERGEPLDGDGEFNAALKEEWEALGFPFVDLSSEPDDPVLTAIQGRRQGDGGPTIADLGTAASVFDLPEVTTLASVLHGIRESELRKHFDVDEMDLLGLPTDGEESELDEFILPQLKRLKTLYDRAVKAGQSVVVVIS